MQLKLQLQSALTQCCNCKQKLYVSYFSIQTAFKTRLINIYTYNLYFYDLTSKIFNL